MKKYHVTYYYLATGMEGIPYTKDFGIIEAKNEEEAKEKASIIDMPVDKMYGPNNKWSTRDFIKGFLTAKPVETSHNNKCCYTCDYFTDCFIVDEHKKRNIDSKKWDFNIDSCTLHNRKTKDN
jgi:hypothetical protein